MIEKKSERQRARGTHIMSLDDFKENSLPFLKTHKNTRPTNE
jgi:hypothetical protein